MTAFLSGSVLLQEFPVDQVAVLTQAITAAEMEFKLALKLKYP